MDKNGDVNLQDCQDDIPDDKELLESLQGEKKADLIKLIMSIRRIATEILDEIYNVDE